MILYNFHVIWIFFALWKNYMFQFNYKCLLTLELNFTSFLHPTPMVFESTETSQSNEWNPMNSIRKVYLKAYNCSLFCLSFIFFSKMKGLIYAHYTLATSSHFTLSAFSFTVAFTNSCLSLDMRWYYWHALFMHGGQNYWSTLLTLISH